MTYAFVVESGPRAGMRVCFPAHAPVVLGRGSEADLLLPEDRTLSRCHARVEVLPDGVYLHDIAGRNTTWVNGFSIRWARLTPGNVVRLGNTLLRLVYEGDDPNVTHVGANDVSVYEVVDAAHYHRGPLPPASSRRPATPQASDAVTVLDAGNVQDQVPCSGCGREERPAPNPDLWDAPWLCPSCQQSRRQRPPDVPERIGGFEILRVVHRGDYGEVLEAVSADLGLHAAVKMLPASDVEPKAMQRFLREQRIVTTLRHPNIVRCYEVGEVQGRPYIVFELLPGGSAIALDGRNEPLQDMLWLGADLFRALGYAHDLGVVHRDVSPANVMLCGNAGAGKRAKLTDFGLAKSALDLQGASVTFAGEAGGTLLTMSPEQVHNFIQVRPSADVYSSAATLFFLLTGETPLVLPCPVHEASMQVLREAIVSPARRSLGEVRADLPPPVVSLLDGLLAYDPSLRERMRASNIAVALGELAERTAQSRWTDTGGAQDARAPGDEALRDKFVAAVEALRECANLLDTYSQMSAAEVRAAAEENDAARVERAMERHRRIQQDLEGVVARWEELRSLV